MKNSGMNKWVLIFFVGSIWGLSEALFGGLLYASEIRGASIYLGAWALFLLSSARYLTNIPGTSTAIGTIAVLFRLVNAGMYICHLGGIFLLGVAFDIAATLLLKHSHTKKGKGALQLARTSGTGVLSSLLSNGLFAFIFTFIVRYSYWASGGWPKVIDHTFVNGGWMALSATISVTLGWKLGQNSRRFARLNLVLANRFALALSLGFWIIGHFVG